MFIVPSSINLRLIALLLVDNKALTSLATSEKIQIKAAVFFVFNLKYSNSIFMLLTLKIQRKMKLKVFT